MKGVGFPICCALVLAACSDSREADAPLPAKDGTPELATRRWDSASVRLPPSIAADILRDYGIEGGETRYIASQLDLNGDNKPEYVVHVVGTAACGTGGCTTLVFTPEGDGFRRVSTITVSSPPVRISPHSSNGWRDVIVHVSGGGAADGDVQLKYAGQGYPENPTLIESAPQTLEGSEVLIPELDTFEDAALLQAAPTGKD